MEERGQNREILSGDNRTGIQESQRFPKKKIRKEGQGYVVFEHGKIQPQAIDLEEAVLGAMMLEKHKLSEVIEIIRPEVFYKEEHQKIFAAIRRLFGQVKPVDILTVTEELRQNGELEMVGGPYYIATLTNRVVSSANIEWHARILIQKFIQRELIRISSDIIHDAYEDTTDVFDLLDKAESNLFSVSESSLRKGSRSMHDILKDAIEGIKTRSQQEEGLIGVGSGFTELDRITAGWQRSDLIVLASRPGMGKTAFALTMARNIAVDFKKPVAVFSLEMSAVQLVMRLIASETEIPAEKLKKGTLTEDEWARLYKKITSLDEAPLYIDDTPALTIFELRAKSRRMKAQHKIEMIILDYLQLMQGTQENKGNREQEISTISRSLKALAKELDIPIIAISQLSREVEKRNVKKPILSDLRESGSIEQDADMVLFIYRPEYYDMNEDAYGGPTHGVAEINIAKNRNGATQVIKLKFEANFAKFSDLDTDYSFPDNISPSSSFDMPKRTRTVPSKMNDDDSFE
jgi:replicative DNA helicase